MKAPEQQSALLARRLRVRGVVQGVGFRPYVYRLARRHGLRGWVLNAEEGVEIHVEGTAASLDRFAAVLASSPPPAARIASVDVQSIRAEGFSDFEIRESTRRARPTVRIAPDLPVCDACLAELFDPADRRYRYPYINCTHCGPRYSLILGLPYDRPQTTMRAWRLCPACAREYHDPADRRFHAQPVACPACGPHVALAGAGATALAHGDDALRHAAAMLSAGSILAIKGLGGYHLACDARDEDAVRALRLRKFRKEKPFALMVVSLGVAHEIVDLSDEAEALLMATARPVVLAPARTVLPGVAPGNQDLGVMLPYTPLHHLLFAEGAPDVLVMTSANRSSEPIAYRDDDARRRLAGLADAFLMGERPIARRVDDSVARASVFGPVLLRRARGYAPGAVAHLPEDRPILAVGPDLKNTVTLVVEGQAFVSQHLGDLAHYPAYEAFQETVEDLLRMYAVPRDALLVAHDAHPEYASTRYALQLPGEHVAVQHHRAHVASVLAEREALDVPILGVAFDGTGYGDDGSIWGGEVFAGSLRRGLRRVRHLFPAVLPGGDAAARHPVQAAAGFLAALGDLPDLSAPPFDFPERYHTARALIDKNVRTFPTTSVGRLFDTVAALLGFTQPVSFEGQAAIWLEHQARTMPVVQPYPFPDLDYRPLLRAIIQDRLRGKPVAEIARGFHAALAHTLVETSRRLAAKHGAEALVLSGGVFQNEVLLAEIHALSKPDLPVWTHRAVPPNDGGISLGQAALAALNPGSGQGQAVEMLER